MEFDTVNPKTLLLGKLAVLSLCFFIIYQMLTSAPPWSVLDYANLLFHEGGHLFFFLFGQFIQILGGSLMQIIIPVIVCINFYRTRQYFSAAFALFWLGQSIINVSIYIRDSSALQLPLLGGESSIHDWNFILSSLNLLMYDVEIATVVAYLGMIVITVGISIMVHNIYIQFKTPQYM